ncbi:putative signal transduction histidine kinase [Carnobacterium divergens]|nr:putative signal transduction histidine kinase [Carnobacterium divergens]
MNDMVLNHKLIFQLLLLFALGAFQEMQHFQQFGFFLLGCLLYFSISLLFYCCKTKKQQQLVALGLLVSLVVFGTFCSQLFYYLIPMTIGGYWVDFALFDRFPWLTFCLVGVPFFIFKDSFLLIASYSLVSLLTFFVLYLEENIQTLTLQLRDYQLNQKQANQRKEQHVSQQQQQLLQLETHNQLAHLFHDEIGHSLTGALIQMEAAKKTMRGNPNQSEHLLNNAIAITKEGVEQIRLVLKQLKPPQESLGIQRLKGDLIAFSTDYAIQTSLQFSGDLTVISPVMWHVFSQNLKEALTNCLKYAQASRIEVELAVYHKFVRLEIKDNGIGTKDFQASLGLTGMEERTAQLGGTLLVVGHPHFTVTTLIPLSTHENSHI